MTTESLDLSAPIVVVGASLAGVRGVESLRRLGATGPITLIGAESHRPYDRPPLSKGFLAGDLGHDRIWLQRSDTAMQDLNITLRLGVSATGLDLGNNVVHTTDGDVPYARLVIATGTSVRRLPHAEGAPVFVVRTLDDSESLAPRLVSGARVVVIGAGFIGAEVASTAASKGCSVTVVEAMPVPLERQLGPEMGGACAALHARNGVDLRAGIGVASIEADAVVLSDGTRLPADVVVVGIGVDPNTEWLEGSGVLLDNGVLCDAATRVLTADGPLDNVVACGDVARWPNALYDETMRIEHWTNAVEMSGHAAATLLGDVQPFAPVPYFWSDQYGVKIQFFGRATGFDEVRVVEGSPADGAGVALYRRGDRLVGVLGLHRMKAVIGYRALLAAGASWTDALTHAGL